MSTTGTIVISDRLWAPPSARTQARIRIAILVIGFALLTAALAQFKITLSFTPVPITGQTLGVLLAGGALGWRAGAASQVAYWLMGLVLPFYSGGTHGWKIATGTNFGYFVGFVAAAALVGYLAQRKQDRNFVSCLSAMALASFMIYVCGAGWLAYDLSIPVATGSTNAISLGVTPFLIGDVIKLALAGALLPAAWALAERNR
ncbi:MAG TPA: biotin transporter BioY [Ilumatobacteraceae bacterium]